MFQHPLLTVHVLCAAVMLQRGRKRRRRPSHVDCLINQILPSGSPFHLSTRFCSQLSRSFAISL